MQRLAVGVLASLLLSACLAGTAPPPQESGAMARAAPSEPSTGLPPLAPPVRVRAAYSVVSGGVAPYWLAADQGLWQRHGLEVELSLISGAPVILSALLTGEVQFALASADAALSIQAREPDVVAFMNISAASVHRLIVAPDIERPEELRGRRIGVFTLGDGNYALMSKALPKFGLNPDRDVIWTPVGGGNMGAFVTALAAGAIDAALLLPPTDLPAIKNGGRVLFNYRDLGLPYAGLPAYTLRRTLDSQRAVVEAFAAGVIDGVRLFKAEPSLGKDVLMRWANITDPEAVEWTYETYRQEGILTDRPFLDIASTRAVMEMLATEQPDLRQVQFERSFDNSVVEALERRGYLSAR
ncbi:MAG TPA: ABC transporter substrate-binding protein [Chloroflexota bacterium]|nr:ABC transporter substrate-binding protein [Chloroflexota bacterium]